MTARTLLVVAVVVLAGCSDDAAPDDLDSGADGAAPPGPGDAADPPGDAPDPALRPETAQWSGCSGMFTAFYWPGPTNPGPAPAGWEPSPDQGTSRVFLLLLDCQRLSWGVLERGPIRMLLEYHNAIEPPQACMPPGSPPPWILTAWWLDDRDAAARLASDEGIPTQTATFDHADDLGGAVASMAWTWARPAGAESALEVRQPGPPAGDGLPDARLFWMAGDAVSSMDLTFSYVAAGPVDGLASGEVGDDLLIGQAPGPYASGGLIMTEADHSAVVGRYGGLACEPA